MAGFEEQLRSHNKLIMDIVQQGLSTGVIRLDNDAVKKQIADIVDELLVAGAGVTITYDQSARTITITLTIMANDRVKLNGTISIKTSTKSRVLLGENSRRHEGTFQNNSPFTLYLTFDKDATPKNWNVKVGPNMLYELPKPEPFQGAIFGVWDGEGKGFVRITEMIK